MGQRAIIPQGERPAADKNDKQDEETGHGEIDIKVGVVDEQQQEAEPCQLQVKDPALLLEQGAGIDNADEEKQRSLYQLRRRQVCIEQKQDE
jgi:hypothetical protein